MSAVAAASYRRTVKFDTEVLDLMVYKAAKLQIDRKQKGQVKTTLELLLRFKLGDELGTAGQYTETYRRSKGACGTYGRFYPQACGMAFVHRPVRGALVRNYYHDLDMVNSLPVITVQYAANKYSHDLPLLRDYVARRPYYYDMVVISTALLHGIEI